MNPFDRAVLLITAACTSTWRNTIMLVKPETVLRWHQQGFRLLWRRKFRSKTKSRRLSADVVALIGQMAKQNKTWGAERIRGELLKLGIRVSKRTIHGERPPSR